LQNHEFAVVGGINLIYGNYSGNIVVFIQKEDIANAV
jgi:hypothetical protein